MAQEAAKNRYKEMRSRGYGYNQDNKDDAKAAAERTTASEGQILLRRVQKTRALGIEIQSAR